MVFVIALSTISSHIPPLTALEFSVKDACAVKYDKYVCRSIRIDVESLERHELSVVQEEKNNCIIGQRPTRTLVRKILGSGGWQSRDFGRAATRLQG